MGKQRQGLNDEALQQLIGTIYDTALSPDRWPQTLEALARAFDAPSADFHSWNRLTRAPEFAITYNMDHMLEEYTAHYIHINPRVAFLDSDPLKRRVFYDYMYTDEQSIRSDEFYNWIEREADAPYGLGIRVEDDEVFQSACGIHFSRRQGHVENGTIARFEVLAPHLTRAVQMSRKVQAQHLQTQPLADALQAMNCGVALVDRHARVTFANEAAEEVLAGRDGLSRDAHGELRTARQKDTAALHEAIARVARPQTLVGGEARLTLLIERPSGKPPYEVRLAPARPAALEGAADGARALLLISQPESPGSLSTEVLQQHYELTPAETRLCTVMLEGGGLPEVPERLGIAESTARSRLKQVLAKTGTNRQTELVALLHRHRRDWRDEDPADAGSKAGHNGQ